MAMDEFIDASAADIFQLDDSEPGFAVKRPGREHTRGFLVGFHALSRFHMHNALGMLRFAL
jgi:hypothetical protein